MDDKVVWVVVGILVATAVASATHQTCNGVAQMKRDRLVAGVLDVLTGAVEGGVGGVALGG